MYLQPPSEQIGHTVEIDDPNHQNNGDVGKIVSHHGSKYVVVQFSDGTETTVTLGQIVFY